MSGAWLGAPTHACACTPAHLPAPPRPQESRWAHIQNTAAKKTLLLGTIKMATLNLFQIVSKQLKETTTVSLEDTHKQLDMVRGSASALPSWVYSAETVVGWSKARMNPPRAVVLKFSRI